MTLKSTLISVSPGGFGFFDFAQVYSLQSRLNKYISDCHGVILVPKFTSFI